MPEPGPVDPIQYLAGVFEASREAMRPFLDAAARGTGSAGEAPPAPAAPGNKRHAVIEPAPGRYVLAKATQALPAGRRARP